MRDEEEDTKSVLPSVDLSDWDRITITKNKQSNDNRIMWSI